MLEEGTEIWRVGWVTVGFSGAWVQECQVGGESWGSLEGGDVEMGEDIAHAWRGGGRGKGVVEGGFESGVDREDVGYAVGVEVRGEGVRREGERKQGENEAIESCVEWSG